MVLLKRYLVFEDVKIYLEKDYFFFIKIGKYKWIEIV